MTTPINIPCPISRSQKLTANSSYLSKTYPPSSYSSSPSAPSALSNSPKTTSITMKKVILYGTPFKNRETIQMLLQDCIDEIDEESAKQVIDNATINRDSSITVITCDEKKAFRYCQNLVENGLDAIIE